MRNKRIRLRRMKFKPSGFAGPPQFLIPNSSFLIKERFNMKLWAGRFQKETDTLVN